MPRDRGGEFSTALFERYARSEKALVAALAEMYVQGVSTRKVKAITEELCGHSFSASAISAINKSLDEALARFAARQLDEAYPYLIVDARYEKIREDGVIRAQAVLIAIDNAIKYSDADSAVEVALTATDGRAAITVRDHGAGVPAEELPYVFERFYRIRGRARRPAEGSGLGLPIAKWIAEKHDGSIAMSSRPGEATELVIELPRLEAKGP